MSTLNSHQIEAARIHGGISMKRRVVSFFLGALLAPICWGQTAQSAGNGTASGETSVSADRLGVQATSGASTNASQATKVSDEGRGAQAASASQLRAGTALQAELVKPLDARKNKVGDEVVAKTTYDVKSHGRVIVPRGSRLIGQVTEVKAHSKDEATSAVGIAFSRAVLRNGTELPVALSIQAIGRGQTSIAAQGDGSMAGGGLNAMGSTGSRTSSGGMLSSVRSTAGGVVTTADSAAGAAVNAAGGTGNTVDASGRLSGSLSSTSQGVVGMPGLSLEAQTSSSTRGSIISSNNGNVHLDSGTELILRVN
jgi:hypothetical protein